MDVEGEDEGGGRWESKVGRSSTTEGLQQQHHLARLALAAAQRTVHWR